MKTQARRFLGAVMTVLERIIGVPMVASTDAGGSMAIPMPRIARPWLRER